MTFKKELRQLINRRSKENESDTPDFILADYLNDCLRVFNKATKRREEWYGNENQLDKILEIPPTSQRVKPGKVK